MSALSAYSGSVEWIEPLLRPRRISHAVFDFDGTLSWLRHGWPDIMYQVVRPAFSLQPGETEQNLHDLLLGDILSLNGKASIYQMVRCAQRAVARGGSPPTPEAWLKEYAVRLETALIQRLQQVRNGAQNDHFVVHGARALLERLASLGVTLIVLSGSAEPGVREEAGLLGLAHFFGPHIYGSSPDRERSSKAAVLTRLLSEEGIPGNQLLSFGDGPVELRLTREAGGVAVGVASDEEINGSGVPDQLKAAQLRAAGAHVLIPDYRDATLLLTSILAV